MQLRCELVAKIEATAEAIASAILQSNRAVFTRYGPVIFIPVSIWTRNVLARMGRLE